jgi:hypothetical protein
MNKYEILYVQITKKQKALITKDAHKRKMSQSAILRDMIDEYYQTDEEPSLKNQDLGDEPTLPGEDE